jgi:hypothetical protein
MSYENTLVILTCRTNFEDPLQCFIFFTGVMTGENIKKCYGNDSVANICVRV